MPAWIIHAAVYSILPIINCEIKIYIYLWNNLVSKAAAELTHKKCTFELIAENKN